MRADQKSWKAYFKDPVILWVGVSFSGVFITYIWKLFDPDNYIITDITFLSWLSSLLAVGYLSTPSGSWYGKGAFAGVCVMVTGVAFKLLHLPGANALIITGLAGIALAYLLLWTKKK